MAAGVATGQAVWTLAASTGVADLVAASQPLFGALTGLALVGFGVRIAAE